MTLPSEAPGAYPPPELLARLRAGKVELHRRHAALPLPEKVRLVIELQRIVLPLIARRRPLRAWERRLDQERGPSICGSPGTPRS